MFIKIETGDTCYPDLTKSLYAYCYFINLNNNTVTFLLYQYVKRFGYGYGCSMSHRLAKSPYPLTPLINTYVKRFHLQHVLHICDLDAYNKCSFRRRSKC